MQKYHVISRSLHWLMAALIIINLGLGLYMIDLVSDNKYDFYDFHKSIGVLVFIILIPRVINRFINKPPALEITLAKWQLIASKLAHFFLYILMFTVATSGYLMSSFYGYPVKLFSIKLPNLVWKNTEYGELFSEIHEIASYALIALIIIHILAVIKHWIEGHKSVLKRML